MRTLASMLAAATVMRPQPQILDRRALLQTLALAPLPAQAATFTDAALIPRSLVVNCVDVPATAAFFTEALGMTVTAERGGAARASFGPTALERPKDFTLGVSSFDVDGGHFSLELQPAKDVAPASPETDAVLYVQIALPLQFRASRMVTYGGELRDGYGAWSVGAPGGLPLRLLVGMNAASPSHCDAITAIHAGDEPPDRLMYVAYRSRDARKSAAWYESRGFKRAPYPRARPFDKKEGESPFDPNPPKGSIYLEAAPSSFGVLLVPDRRAKPPSTGVAAVGALRLAARDRAERIQDPDGNTLEVSADFIR